ncbi:MAG: hypothetical protein P9E24_12330 [Candidatus Competibacter sp.]|nr:hypothetical protein [Candidatus Competibacter sp.]MDG4585190.1 hypothetical protein [Candidatus Competibacter sp.]
MGDALGRRAHTSNIPTTLGQFMHNATVAAAKFKQLPFAGWQVQAAEQVGRSIAGNK